MADLNLERTYIIQISSQLSKFEKKRKDLWNCRCPICGDSKTNPHKKRFYIFPHNGAYWTKCHNCAYTQTFKTFLKEFDNIAYKQYVLDDMEGCGKSLKKDRFDPKYLKSKIKKKAIVNGFSYEPLIKFEHLLSSHPARVYVEDRMIPLDRILYCQDFAKFINTLSIEHYKISYRNAHEPRIIIPFFRPDGLSTVFQARAFSNKEGLRYITIKEHEQEMKIFGLDRIDHTKPVFILEGPIDSMMIPNAISMSGISASLPKDLRDVIFVFDNEPRNSNVVKSMKKRLLSGEKVVILPERIKEKDINDMIVKGGFRPERVLDILLNNVYSGSIGILRLNKWMRC